MPLNKLNIKDKNLFNKFLRLKKHQLSCYALENIYIWRRLFDIYWEIIKDCLCIFFKDKMGCFLYLPPLARQIKPQVLEEVFRLMDSFNQNKDISRIENIEEKDLSFYQELGYTCQEKFSDYLCLRQELVQLKGNRFKSKRACFNYFIKHYKFEYLPFYLRYRNDCLKLYNQWMKMRLVKNSSLLYQGMLKDSLACLKILMKDYANLDFMGRIVKVDNKIKGFSFGFKLNPDTFCILYEITDLTIKGLSQFIFREFCRELKNYKYINIMDDSGLESLKKVKLSYHPARLIPSYIATRKKCLKI